MCSLHYYRGRYLWHLQGSSLVSRRQWHQKKTKKQFPCLQCLPSPYISATWNCLKRWAVIKYCRADIMTGKIKERKQKKGQTNSRPIMPPPTPRLSPPLLIKDTRTQIEHWSATTLLLWSSVLTMFTQSLATSLNTTSTRFLTPLEKINSPNNAGKLYLKQCSYPIEWCF